MRTVCGWERLVQTLVGRGAAPVTEVRSLAGGREPLLDGRFGEQRRHGVQLDQVDATTCGSAVLVALAAWANTAEVRRLDGEGAAGAAGFGARYDARQRQVHRESRRFWPQALGTTPWGMAAWLRRHVPGARPYHVRLVDDVSTADVTDVLNAVTAALLAGRPVPLLLGRFVPRHYVLALGLHRGGWRVYDPASGQVRALDLQLVLQRSLAPVLGYDRLHAALLPT
ncbi:MAG: hypothetical protein ACR2GH_07905 [Pseudonocardia sp.]